LRTGAGRPWLAVRLGCTDYEEALALQRRIVAAKIGEPSRSDVMLRLEHPPVFTLGRRGGSENIVAADCTLDGVEVPVVQVERGGNITYHGPGQLVVYPLVDLRRAGLSVVSFVEGMEWAMIETAARWGISAKTDPRNRGAWVGNDKLGSIGITVRRGVSFHGLALNVNTELRPFSWIHPCGLQGVGVTSMAAILGRFLDMEAVGAALERNLEAAFRMVLVKTSLDELLRGLPPEDPVR
jgi:lipoate-protein ligase B